MARDVTKSEIGRDTLTEQVYSVLRERILSGRLKQGERIGEISVSEELGVSATPVREAIRLLNGDNLITYEGRRGARVISPTAAEIRQCYDVRLALEALALKEAASNFTEDDKKRFLKLAEKTRSPGVSAKQFIEADRAFHSFFIEKAENTWLRNFHSAIIDFLLVVRLPTMNSERFASTGDEHVQIAQAICDGKIEQGLNVLERQIRRSCLWAIETHPENNSSHPKVAK